MKSAVVICGGSKCDIRSICESAQTSGESVAELQAEIQTRAEMIHTNLTTLFWQPSFPLSSCPPAARLLVDKGSTSGKKMLQQTAPAENIRKPTQNHTCGALVCFF